MHVVIQSVCRHFRTRDLVGSVLFPFLPLGGLVRGIGNFCYIFQFYWETQKSQRWLYWMRLEGKLSVYCSGQQLMFRET